jgi:hypothetical protein
MEKVLMDIRAFRLITGEDIIAEVVANKGDSWDLRNPVQLAMVPSQADPTKNTFGFVPYPSYTDVKEIRFLDQHLIFVITPAKEFIDQYDRIFGVGIIMPSNKVIS